jgi:hypothetical protein
MNEFLLEFRTSQRQEAETATSGPGISQERAAERLGVSARAGQWYAAEGPPNAVAMLLKLMLRLGLKVEYAPPA